MERIASARQAVERRSKARLARLSKARTTLEARGMGDTETASE